MVEPVLPETPGSRLKLARINKFGPGSSGPKAAMLLGVPRGTYVCLENDTRIITAKRAKELAPKLGVTPEWILYGAPMQFSHTEEKPPHHVNIFLASDLLAFMSWCDGLQPSTQNSVMVDSMRQLPERVALVEIPDGAMMRETYPCYPRGAYAFVVPADLAAVIGRKGEVVVLAVIAGREEAVFRVFRRGDDGRTLLRAFDDLHYEDIAFDAGRGDRIAGVVMGIMHFE